ncbi:MAG TPA: RcnB family protein, partial [Allosphingosinicella sp.]|nr:RcnB family protein [Allosphingosinicella sp.]
HHRNRNYSGYHRIDRGFVLPQAWWGPRYGISNWSAYGLPQPIHGGRWVRYYDDALMIDSYGRVHDGRWGMSWDDRDDRWSYDDRGAPYRGGDDDYYDEDYYEDDRDGRYDDHRGGHGYERGYSHGAPCAQACGPHPRAYGQHHGYGYGYGYGSGMVVTETTVTTHPSVVTHHYVEEQVLHQRRAAKPRKHRAKPRYHRPAPPPPGERG